MHVVIKKPRPPAPENQAPVCAYKRTTKRPKNNLSKYTQQAAAAAATTIRQNTKNLHFEQLTLCSTASSNPITALSHTRRRKVERRMFSLLFLLFIFVAEGELKYQRKKLELENRKPLEKKESKRQPQKLDITKAAGKTSKHATLVGSGTGHSFFFLNFQLLRRSRCCLRELGAQRVRVFGTREREKREKKALEHIGNLGNTLGT
jgi:hypothetical protein